MANDIKIGIQVSSGGTTDAEIKKAENLKRALDAAQQSGARLGSGTAGSRKAAAMAATGTGAMMSGQEYGQMRGAAGATGASARDFANQAQGLGGLVRLYATFAANIFAVSAAFTALKNAADVENLTKGLNTLGAQSGVALGTLSKRLVEVTDGAVSMREAMSSVAMSSSAGMSSKNIERLALVAKNASLALGISMPDALNRLSRGVVKLEPELLDELGLFTKIGPATEKYALEIGKSATALTDFERRQAFANAVLEEGEKKFNALNEAAANPYDKLLASLKNVATSGLNVINVVLTPIVELLAKSPTALLAGLVGVAGILIKQALPALGQFKAGLQRTAAEAQAAAQGKAGDALAAREQLNKLIEAKVERSADKQLAIFEDLEKKLYATAAAGNTRRSALWQTLKKQVDEISDADIAASEKSVKRLEDRAKKDPRLKAQAESERATLEGLKAVIKAEDDLVKVKLQNRDLIEANLKATGQFGRVQQAARDADLKAQKDAIVANTAYNSTLVGIRGSWTLASEQIKVANLNLGIFGSTLLTIRVGVASLAGVFTALGAVINKAFAALALVGGVFSIFDGLLSKNSKEAARFGSALDAANESANNVKRTLDAAKDQEGFGTRTLENTVALSTAMNELTQSARGAIKAAEEANKRASTWDNFWDGLFSLVGMGRNQKLAKAISAQISSAIQLLEREGLDTEFKQQLQKVLQVQDLKDLDEVEKAFRRLSDAQKESVGIILERGRNKLGQAASTLQTFKDSVDSASKSYKEYIQSLADNNPLIKLGQSMMQASVAILEVGDDTNRLAQVFEYLAKSGNAVGLITDNNIDQFVKINNAFLEQKRNIDNSTTSLANYKQELINVGRAERNRPPPAVELSQPRGSYARGGQEMLNRSAINARVLSPQEDLLDKIRLVNRSLASQSTQAIKEGGDFAKKVAVDGFKEGAELIRRALDEARRQAQAQIDKTLQAGLTGRERAQADAQAQLEDIRAQIAVVNSNIEVAKRQGVMADKLEQSNILQEQANTLLKIDLAKRQDAKADTSGLESDVKALQKRLDFQNAVVSGDFSKLATEQEQRAATLRKELKDSATAGLTATLIKLQGTAKSIELGGVRAQSKGTEEDDQKKILAQTRITQAELQRQQILQSIAGITSRETVLAQIVAENKEFETKQLNEILNYNNELVRLEYERTMLSLLSKDPEKLALLDSQIQKQTELRDGAVAAQKIEKDNKGLQDRQKLLAVELQQINQRFELLAAQRAKDDTISQAMLEYRSKEIDLTNELYDITGSSRIQRTYLLDTERASLENQRALNAASDAYNKQRTEIQAKQATIKDRESQAYKDTQAELDRILILNGLNIDKINAEYKGKLAVLELQRSLTLEQQRYNDILDRSKSITEGLKSAFGDLGEKLGLVGESLVNIAVQNEKNAKALENNAKKRASYDSSEQVPKELIQEEMELRKKAQRDELAGNIKLVSSAKSLFKEKTGAYKTLAAIEKALHIQKIAMDFKEMATKLFTDKAEVASKASTVATETALEGTSLAARIPTMITGIFGKITSQLGWFGPVVAAGIVASIFGRSMSKTATIPKGFNAEEQQAVQGTGQQYVNGKLVERQGGVLGDVTLKADSITQSLDKLSQEFFGSLGSSSSKIVQALEGIKKNTGDTVKALLGSISGFGMTGSAFGTVESSSKKLGGIWGSASTSIADAGVRITGTLDGLGRAIGQFEQYENVVRTSSSWFGLVKSTSTETNVKRFEESTTKLFANIFKSVQTVLLESAVALEGPASAAAEAIKNIPVQLSVSLKGLTGEQAVEAVLAELSVTLNQGAQQIFPFIEQYQKIGEEYYETVARIVKESETLTMGLSMVGIAIQGLGTQARIALEQQLIDQLGGVDKAVSSINFYYENFLTSEERFRIQFNQLTKTFRDAGKTLPQTKEKFIELLNSLDIVNNPEDQKTFALLINNAEKYNGLLELQAEIIGDTQQKFKDFAKSLLSFKDSLLLGSATILTPIERYAKAKTEFETVRAKALAGDQESLGKLQDASQTFLNVSRELYASGQQYTADFTSVLNALDSAASYAQKQADMGQMQLDALNTQIGVLQSIERILTVQESRTATIPTTPTRQEALSVIDRTNQTLDTLTTAVDTLSDFVFDRFSATQERAGGGYASGMTLVGERGPELVDFTNPGQVYTAEQTRGMFAPRTASGQAFNAMVSELQDLREEVVLLRKEQQKQTGDMIITNYDAQQKVATEIVDAVMQSVQEKSWQDKNKPTIS